MNLKDKIIIVTGGSGLIGKAILKSIRSKGGIALNFDISVSTSIRQFNYQCDVTDQNSILDGIEWVLVNFNKIDGLVNNAYPKTKDFSVSFEDMSPENLEKNVSWQLNSAILFSKEVIKIMKKNHKGSIVNIASIYGEVANDWTVYEGTDMVSPAPYAAIKGGLINFTRYIASLYGRHGVRANCISPGGVFNQQPESFVAAYEKKVPLSRMGVPDDFGGPVSFLLSDESKYITGQNIIVDGGWTIV